MPITRGQMERQLRMGGGIMQVAPRQGALLGGLKKAVKGVAKGIGSLLKSDVGKLGLLTLGGFGLAGKGPLQFLVGGLENLGLKELLTKKAADVTLGDTLKVGAMGTVLGGVLSTLDPQEEEEIVQKRNLGALKSKLTKAYQDLNYDPAEIPALVANDMSEYNKDMFRGAMAEGGRIGFANGAQFTSGGNISPGTDVKGNVRDDNPYTGGGGGGGPSGPPSVINPPEPKTIRDRLKERGIETLNFAKKYNPLGLLFGTPVGAAEFDMEAFQKAGAEKGFFGMNDELEAMQKYYVFAQKQKAIGKDPAAIRDSANIGSSLYGIDMELVPETFLQTE